MTVNGGRVKISVISIDRQYPAKMEARISLDPNFLEDMPELVEIVKKRLIEAQMKINLEICGAIDGDKL